MQQFKLILAGLLLLLLSANVNAQGKKGADYFAGKWNMLVKGTPDGDAKMVFVLDKKDTTLIGIVQDSTGKEISKITNMELKDSVLTVYFSAQGYDINVVMNRKDDDHVVGSLMGMFDTEGERIKAVKKD
ncbi:MAG TPA: hypothetical protein VKT28_11575 [Puia sp.]|nr:hypothetical protein [Puia sp.]